MSKGQVAERDRTALADAVQVLAGAIAEVRTLAEARASRVPAGVRR